MTQEEKLEEAKKLYKTANQDQRYVLEKLFPELAESEDEKIRNWLIGYFHQYKEDGMEKYANGLKVESIIAWLEKQYEKKVSYTTLMETGNGGINALVTKELPTDGCDDEQKHYIDIDKMVDDYANNKERGNEEFGKPVPCMIRAYRQGLNDAIEKVVRNPAWSEEDNIILSRIIADYERSNEEWFNAQNSLPHSRKITWLKSLRPQNTWKPSEGQLDALKRTQTGVIQFSVLQNLYNDLKKL